MAANSTPAVGAGVLLRTLRKGRPGSEHPKHGDNCLVHYEGFLEDGTVFESSRARNIPIQFRLGFGHVMEGWEVAVPRMSKDQIAEVTIPHLFAYGEQGYPPKIPPRATLMFRMELLDFNAACFSMKNSQVSLDDTVSQRK